MATSMKNNMLNKVKVKLSVFLNAINKQKSLIETIAALLAIAGVITGFLFWVYGKLNHVQITAKMEPVLGCSVTGVADSCALFDAYGPDYMPKFIFNINNRNSLPIFFDTDSITVEVLDYIPFDQLEIGEEWGGGAQWIEPIKWNAIIDTVPNIYTAIPESNTEDISNIFLKVDGSDYVRFQLTIIPQEAGYYKIRTKVKYQYKGKYITFQSNLFHLVCRSGYSEFKKRENNEVGIPQIFDNQINEHNDSIINPPDENTIWFPVSAKHYSTIGCLLTDIEWEYDAEGNIIKYSKSDGRIESNGEEMIIDCQNGFIDHIDYIENSELILQESYAYDYRVKDPLRISNAIALAPEGSDAQEYSTFFQYYDDYSIRKTVYSGVTGPILSDEEYYFQKDNKLSRIENIGKNVNELYRVTVYFYDKYGNRFRKDSNERYIYNSDGMIYEAIDDQRGDGYCYNRSFKYDTNGLLVNEIRSNPFHEEIVDYEYMQFPKTEITERVFFYMQLLGIANKP